MKKIAVLSLVLFALSAGAQQPIDVAVKQVNDRRSNGFFAQLNINLELPKVQSSEVAASRVLITSATDDSGKSLLDPEAAEPEFVPNPSRPGEPPRPASISVTLENPDRKASKVKEVRGQIELYMPGKDPNSVAEVAKFLSQAGKPFNHKALEANGVEIALLSEAQIAAEKKKRADAKKKEYEEMGFAGEDLENMLESMLESLLGVEETELLARVKDPNGRIQDFAFVDAKGEVKHVSTRDDEGFLRLSTWEKPQADWKLRVMMKTPKNIARYAFALNDVPLP